MEEESDSFEAIKKYTRELRNLIENEKLLTLSDFKSIQSKYVLSKDDIDKVEDIAIKSYEEAKSNYDFGNWDTALSSIEEAFYKSPFNIEILVLYCKILIENNKFSEKDDLSEKINPILGRLNQVDKKEFNKIKNIIKSDKKKINKIVFIPLIIVPILLIIFIIKISGTEKEFVEQEYIFKDAIVNGEIPVTIDSKNHTSEIKIDILKSKLDSSSRNFLYNLQFLIHSEKENLVEINGEIIWLDRSDNVIFSEPFYAGDKNEYYLNEKIPVTYSKNTLINSLDLYNIIIKIDSIISLPGRDRANLSDIQFKLPDGIYRDLSFKQGEFYFTEGVVSNYLSITIILTNNDIKPLNTLKGNIVWLDDYDIVKTSNTIDFITGDDIVLNTNESRKLHKTIELNGDVTSKYILEIVTIE